MIKVERIQATSEGIGRVTILLSADERELLERLIKARMTGAWVKTLEAIPAAPKAAS